MDLRPSRASSSSDAGRGSIPRAEAHDERLARTAPTDREKG